MEKNQVFRALETIGWGRYNLQVFLVCGLVNYIKAWFTYDAWYVNLAYTLQGVNEEWGVSAVYLGIIGSFLQIGMASGSLIWGLLSDSKGRKLPYRLSAFIGLLSSISLLLSQNPFMVVLSIFFQGISLAGDLSLSGTVLLESCPPSKRYLLTMLSLFLYSGAIGASGLALLTVSFNNTGIKNWRLITGSICIFSILNFIARFKIEESPAYLFAKKNIIEAEKTLNIISLTNKNKEFVFTDLNTSLMQDNKLENSNSALKNLPENPTFSMIFKYIFGPELLSTTIKLSLGQISVTFAYAGLLGFMPEFLKFLPTSQAYFIIFLQQTVGLAGTLMSSWMVETNLGRRYTTGIGFSLSGLFGILFLLEEDLIFVTIITTIMYLFISLGFSAIFTIGPESYPTQVRSTGYGIICILSRIGALFGPIVAGELLSWPNGKTVCLGLFSLNFLFGGFMVMLMKETKPISKDLKNVQ